MAGNNRRSFKLLETKHRKSVILRRNRHARGLRRRHSSIRGTLPNGLKHFPALQDLSWRGWSLPSLQKLLASHNRPKIILPKFSLRWKRCRNHDRRPPSQTKYNESRHRIDIDKVYKLGGIRKHREPDGRSWAGSRSRCELWQHWGNYIEFHVQARWVDTWWPNVYYVGSALKVRQERKWWWDVYGDAARAVSNWVVQLWCAQQFAGFGVAQEENS